MCDCVKKWRWKPVYFCLIVVLGGAQFACTQEDDSSTGVEWIYSEPAGIEFTKTEITVAQWESCKNAGECATKHVWDKNFTEYCNLGYGDRGNHPMNCIDWEGSKQVCEYFGGRLPTENEWYAEASNGDSWVWPWGDSPVVSCDYAIWAGDDKGSGCGKDSTWPVCSKPNGNSVSGLCDMSGNVWEWTSTNYNGDKVVRGGSWGVDYSANLRASARYRLVPDGRYDDIDGCRCVR